MNRVMDGVALICMYIDDDNVFGPDSASHVSTTYDIVDRLGLHYLKVEPHKARPGSTSTDFLRHKIIPTGLKLTVSKVTALLQMPMPTNVSHLRSMSGGILYYRRFPSDVSKRL